MLISCQKDLIFIGLHFLRRERSCVIARYDSVDYEFTCGSFISYKLFCEPCLMDPQRVQLHLRGQCLTLLAPTGRCCNYTNPSPLTLIRKCNILKNILANLVMRANDDRSFNLISIIVPSLLKPCFWYSQTVLMTIDFLYMKNSNFSKYI